MADAKTPATTREQRLAAKLRENLHRRKAQARALDGAGGGWPGSDSPGADSACVESARVDSDGADSGSADSGRGESAALSKSAPKS